MLAYHNDPVIKADILTQLQAHHDADEIVKGQYWQNGKGCAVGCTIHGDNHANYERLFGIPRGLARLEDKIFESLPNSDAMGWPLRFMGAIAPGADLSMVGPKFNRWVLHSIMLPDADEAAEATIRGTIAVLDGLIATGTVDAGVAYSAAYSAADSTAYSAADSAANRVGNSAAYSAADSAAWGAAYNAAYNAAYSAAWSAMADKLIELLETA